MSEGREALLAHFKTGHSTVCHCWSLQRKDGTLLGFTDHDVDLSFEGISFRAATGLSALALQQTTGLSVDNTEAIGALTDATIREEDIEAGRYDSAEVKAWLVNWQDVTQRDCIFRGHIGEVRRAGGAFQAELRGLTDPLNQPSGRVFQKPCSAVLGDTSCRFDLGQSGYFADVAISETEERRIFRFEGLSQFEEGWFRFGVLRVLAGAAKDLSGIIKRDYFEDETRVVELWHPLRADIKVGDSVRIEAGCDKRPDTCRFKFSNFLNFQGFPDIPGDDWTFVDPGRATEVDGGSRRS